MFQIKTRAPVTPLVTKSTTLKLSPATAPPQRSNENIFTKNAQKKNLLLVLFLENMQIKAD